MSEPRTLADRFHALHVPGTPLVLFNIWDAGSARAVAAAGAAALATGSWSVAAAHGYADGECVPAALVFDNLARIVRAVDLPVSVDLEAGYGATPAAVGETITRAIDAGAVGCNLEDSLPGDGRLREAAAQAERLAAARAAADAAGTRFFLNARCDVYFQPDARSQSPQALQDAALARADAYAAAGADGLFLPGLADPVSIAAIAAATPLRLNLMMMGQAMPPAADLARLGVARISHGPGPYRTAMQALQDAATAALRFPPAS